MFFTIFGLVFGFLQRLQSNASHVLLKAVEPSISGKFSCEVSADAPSFHTELQAAEMEVVGKFYMINFLNKLKLALELSGID